ncbi:MAG: hypothetical protein J0L52_04355 [Caulobacterales bacterium]|nr:hypothetical protein [Caulobacterales bacterium]
MLSRTQWTAGAAILSALALGACGLIGGDSDEKGGDSSSSSGGTSASGGGGGGGTTASGGTGGAKPEDQGAGGGSSGGTAASGGSGGQASGGSGSGGGDMQEVGNVIEGFTGQLDGYLDNYQENLASGFGSAGVRDVITGLQAGNEYRWSLGTLRGGQTYRILGACDQDCTDVDLFLEDSRGQQIGQDIALDDHPLIELTPGRDEQFTVRIRLVNCEVEPCYVAGRVLQQGR